MLDKRKEIQNKPKQIKANKYRDPLRENFLQTIPDILYIALWAQQAVSDISHEVKHFLSCKN
jgi:hypothetical protein